MCACKANSVRVGRDDILDCLKRVKQENPSFFYSASGGDGEISWSVFWVDSISRMNYGCFGDTVIFDTDQRMKNGEATLAIFAGLNHHGQPVLFGCGFLFNLSESLLVWLLQTWLHAMSGRHPVSITTTAPNTVIHTAVTRVFPRTRRRFCRWGIFRQSLEKLSEVHVSNPDFEAEFQKIVNDTETVEEFESSWGSLIERYCLADNEWLRSLFHVRQQWVPVYVKDCFFGDVAAGIRGGGVTDVFFRGCVNASASTSARVIIEQVENAAKRWQESERRADADTGTVLKTPSPVEEQAAGIYTKEIFVKFQEELVAALASSTTEVGESSGVSVYRVVATLGGDGRSREVLFNVAEDEVSCGCRMFESCGIICRHILAVFRSRNVLNDGQETLPSRYILKRWTRNAKDGYATNEFISEQGGSNPEESPNVLYENLHREAIKYAEEGAKSMYSYTVAMEALQVAVNVVAGAGPGDSSTSPVSGDESSLRASSSLAEKRSKISRLAAELDKTNARCEIHRSHLLTVLRHIEEQKLKLSIKIENAKLNLKD